ncbi:phosphohydrolase [Heliophilum fasciatum]|uniref:HD domain-containing protein n=1 Tax=Heliophilum fasciatum TaxID=35700 RepID=A0A4R2RM41_9FIRM|nr:phosphohydrolase [Heliophilum fasciatum]MCW2278382.1 5'-deoxynucleotidase YfbR-like HD superfamily hydrolase [Heliophilum fasciatum]TCP63719.1 hypothetical protein EDD73_11663 [Heliophilum fasciatum]
MSDYILTYSKQRMRPLEPAEEEIHLIDIAHALSLMTRANGHFPHFYSVAQHAINCCKEAKSRGYSKRVQLACLLHDASESYLSDITRPVKKNLPAYFPIEEKLQKLIYQRFGLGDLTEEEQAQVRHVDDTLLYYEFYELMGTAIFDQAPVKSMEHDFTQKDFLSVEYEFIALHESINSDYRCLGIDACQGAWVAGS